MKYCENFIAFFSKFQMAKIKSSNLVVTSESTSLNFSLIKKCLFIWNSVDQSVCSSQNYKFTDKVAIALNNKWK